MAESNSFNEIHKINVILLSYEWFVFLTNCLHLRYFSIVEDLLEEDDI